MTKNKITDDDPSHRSRVENYISQAGGNLIDHPGGTLAAHLGRIAAMLQSWDLERSVVDAGHLHAAYGTEGFGIAIGNSVGQVELIDLVGEEAEELISLYCRCDRNASYSSWVSDKPYVVDRENGNIVSINDVQRKALINITVANETDVLAHDPDLMKQHGKSLAALFGGWRKYLSRPALENLDEWLSTIKSQNN